MRVSGAATWAGTSGPGQTTGGAPRGGAAAETIPGGPSKAMHFCMMSACYNCTARPAARFFLTWGRAMQARLAHWTGAVARIDRSQQHSPTPLVHNGMAAARQRALPCRGSYAGRRARAPAPKSAPAAYLDHYQHQPRFQARDRGRAGGKKSRSPVLANGKATGLRAPRQRRGWAPGAACALEKTLQKHKTHHAPTQDQLRAPAEHKLAAPTAAAAVRRHGYTALGIMHATRHDKARGIER